MISIFRPAIPNLNASFANIPNRRNQASILSLLNKGDVECTLCYTVRYSGVFFPSPVLLEAAHVPMDLVILDSL